MTFHRHRGQGQKLVLGLALAAMLSACGGGGGSSGLFGGGAPQQAPVADAGDSSTTGTRSTFRDLFRRGDDPNVTIKVNKYIWQASLDVLNFLPVESVDPFTGVIVTGFGRPPGGGRAYRATIFVQDPALDARSLKLAMQVQGGGAVDPATVRAVEDAILTRARQLRVRDNKL